MHQTLDGEHGRIEQRRGYAVEVAGRGLIDTEGWADLRSVLLIESARSVGEQTSLEQRLFISSLEADARCLMKSHLLKYPHSGWDFIDHDHLVMTLRISPTNPSFAPSLEDWADIQYDYNHRLEWGLLRE